MIVTSVLLLPRYVQKKKYAPNRHFKATFFFSGKIFKEKLGLHTQWWERRWRSKWRMSGPRSSLGYAQEQPRRVPTPSVGPEAPGDEKLDQARPDEDAAAHGQEPDLQPRSLRHRRSGRRRSAGLRMCGDASHRTAASSETGRNLNPKHPLPSKIRSFLSSIESCGYSYPRRERVMDAAK